MPTPSPCACGCGGTPSKGHYLRGHYTRVAKQTSIGQLLGEDPPGEDEQTPRSSLINRPVGQLLVAVFSEAWEHKDECERRQEGLYCPQCAQDRRWAMATAASWVYSFVTTCDYLGLDPDTVRVRFLATVG